MIWKIKTPPKPKYKDWDTRIIRRFAFFPVEISGRRMIWLQWYYVKRILLGVLWTDLTDHRYATMDELEIGEFENVINA